MHRNVTKTQAVSYWDTRVDAQIVSSVFSLRLSLYNHNDKIASIKTTQGGFLSSSLFTLPPSNSQTCCPLQQHTTPGQINVHNSFRITELQAE